MNKVCCVGDASVYPKSSSCSMVLRSACSHGHSHESCAVKEHFHASTKRKSTSKRTSSKSSSVSLESALESSFKQLALKSAEKTYSLLKEGFYNSFELSDTVDQKVYQVSSLNVSCAKELHFSPLSPSDDSHVFNNVSDKECSSDYSVANQSDMNSSASSTSNMSGSSRRFTRSSVSSMRNLSGSEGDDDITVQRVVRTGRKVSESSNSLNSSASFSNSDYTYNSLYKERKSNGLFSNNHDSHYESQNILNSHLTKFSDYSSEDRANMMDPLQLGKSTIQYSMLDRFRWFLWKWAYLKIIKTISFDVWLLSSVRDYGKSKVIFFLLLPLLLFLVWGLFQHSPVSPVSFEDVSEAIKSASSFVLTIWSSLFSSIYSLLVHEEKEEVIVESESCGETCSVGPSRIFSIFTGVASVFSAIPGLFVRDTSDSSSMEYEYEQSQYHKMDENVVNSYQPSREEMKIMAAQFFKEEMASLKEFIKNSVHESKADNVKKELKLQNEMKNLQLEVKSLSGILGKLETDIQKQEEKNQKSENIIVQTSEYRQDIDHLHVKLKTLETKLGVLEQLKSCCDKQLRPEDIMILLEKHLLSAFRTIVNGDDDPSSKYYFFNEWLNLKFFSHEKLMQEINAALKKQSLHAEKPLNYDYVMKVVESTVVKHVDSIKKNLTDMNMFSYSSFTDDYFSEDKIKKIVKEAIMLYDADKTGQVDYALESGGGSVLGTRCSETYVEKYGKISFFGIPVWTSSNSPRTAIQPDVQPGRCWAFKGSQGFLVLELSATIYPSGFTMEHIPVSLSPTGSIDSAPKGFSVWGLESDKDSKGTLLGEYVYEIDGEPLQYFPVQRPSDRPYTYIELQIQSNHGNLEYTCLYRFRVHGRRHA